MLKLITFVFGMLNNTPINSITCSEVLDGIADNNTVSFETFFFSETQNNKSINLLNTVIAKEDNKLKIVSETLKSKDVSKIRTKKALYDFSDIETNFTRDVNSEFLLDDVSIMVAFNKRNKESINYTDMLRYTNINELDISEDCPVELISFFDPSIEYLKINKEKIIYIDPYHIDKNYNDADIIFITHDHYDHYSEDDIDKVRKFNSIFVIPDDLLPKLLEKGINQENIFTLDSGDTEIIDGIKVEAVPAYNTNKPFHPKENNWLGYIIEIKGVRYYIAGDTDITEENKKVKCDVAFVPVGGTYTMDFKEAAQLINIIKPKFAIPVHYGSVVGSKQDATDFIKLLYPTIKVINLINQ